MCSFKIKKSDRPNNHPFQVTYIFKNYLSLFPDFFVVLLLDLVEGFFPLPGFSSVCFVLVVFAFGFSLGLAFVLGSFFFSTGSSFTSSIFSFGCSISAFSFFGVFGLT